MQLAWFLDITRKSSGYLIERNFIPPFCCLKQSHWIFLTKDIPLNAKAYFTCSLAKLKPDDIHWITARVQPQFLLRRIKNGHGLFSSVAELKAFRIALSSSPLNEPCYTLIHFWLLIIAWLFALQTGIVKIVLSEAINFKNKITLDDAAV